MLSLSVVLAAAFQVVLPDAPQSWERTAAEELETVLSVCADESLTVDGDKGVRFHVGDTKLADAKRLLSSSLQDEEWVVKSFGRDVVVNGGGSHGALYAVSHFLEDVCGVRFWNDTETDFPKEKVRAIPSLDLRGRPVLRYRDIYRGSSTNATPRFAIRRRLNRNGESRIPLELGGEFNYGPPYHCHTFDRYIPWGQYGKEHPEWFSLWEGRRVGGITGGQLCLTNPEVRKLLREKLLASIAAGEAAAKKAGVPPPRLYDLSQNDAYGRYCQCEKCAAEVGKYGHSGFYLNVINAIADEVAKKYPYVFITTLAYEFTEPPPKGGVRPRDNVIVKLCDTRSNEAASLAEPCNDEFRGFLESWGKIASNLLVWDYAGVYVNPAVLFPFASEFGMGDTYRMFHENHVMGVFIEHPGTYDMHDLKYYLVSKLFENPQLETKALIIDFMTGYFGAAARPILKARRHLDRIRRERNGYITFMPPCEKFDFVRLDDLTLMASLWDEAEAAVKDDPKRLARVKRCRGSQDALLRFRMSDPKVEDGRFVFDPVAFDCGKGPARIVKDEKSPSGEAVRLPKEPKDLFVGLYAPTEGKHTFEATFPPAKDGEYVWYEFRDVRVPKPAQNVFYFSKRWNPHLGIYHPDLNGKTCTLRVCAKFAEEIDIARVEFVPTRFSRANIIGHRGDWENAPENTIESFRAALDNGFGVELDLYVLPDGRVISSHNKPVPGKEYPEIGQILDLVRPGSHFILDLKGGGSDEQLIGPIRREMEKRPSVTPETVTFFGGAGWIRKNLPGYRSGHVHLLRKGWKPDDPPIDDIRGEIERAAKRDAGLWAPRWDAELLSAELIALAHAKGLKVAVWTVNDAASALEALRRGVDFVETDRPTSLYREMCQM